MIRIIGFVALAWLIHLALGFTNEPSLCEGISYDHECEMKAARAESQRQANQAAVHTLLR